MNQEAVDRLKVMIGICIFCLKSETCSMRQRDMEKEKPPVVRECGRFREKGKGL